MWLFVPQQSGWVAPWGQAHSAAYHAPCQKASLPNPPTQTFITGRKGNIHAMWRKVLDRENTIKGTVGKGSIYVHCTLYSAHIKWDRMYIYVKLALYWNNLGPEKDPLGLVSNWWGCPLSWWCPPASRAWSPPGISGTFLIDFQTWWSPLKRLSEESL